MPGLKNYSTVKIYLFDSSNSHKNLLPLSFTRPLADFRCGILTIREKWERCLPGECYFYPMEYLRDKFGTVSDPDEEVLFIAGNILPRQEFLTVLKNLQSGCALIEEDKESENPLDSILAFRGTLNQLLSQKYNKTVSETSPVCIKYVFDIFLLNADEIKLDYVRLTAGRKSQPIPECVRALCSSKIGSGQNNLGSWQSEPVFIEEGAVVECASINVNEGPVYIGKDTVLMEGACIRGPFALCECSEVRMGAKIYEGTTIGPHCKVGGEISNAVFFGYSNKAHDGYLGNAVIGEWCNIGAGTNASNLKNDYSLIRVWNYNTGKFMKTDLQFCGLIMGDHSKIGVNCMINTATVIGVGVNIHGSGFPRSFVPCFCEGSPVTGFSHVPLKKFLDTAERVMSRREIPLSEKEKDLLTHIYEYEENY